MQVAVTFPCTPAIRHSMKFDKQLGQGKFKVFLVKNPALNAEYALKVFSRDWALREHYGRESKCISKLDHPNIIKHVPILSHNFRMDIVLTEYTPNGDLLDFVMKGCLQNEQLVRSYFHQLIEGMSHLNDQGIAHLDLKLENLLLDKDYILKIIDFDQSQHLHEDKLYSYGTTGYRAPEVRDKTCQDFLPVDVYAAGIILFTFKAREFPFVESSDRSVKEVTYYDQFCDNNEEFWREKAAKKHDAGFYSEEFKELFNGMCCKDPSKRFTIDDIKKSKWYSGPVYSREECTKEVEKIIAENVQSQE